MRQSADREQFRHTPYDGSARPFSIGLRPLPPERWIEPDGRLEAELAEKRALVAGRRDVVVRAEPGTRPAQAELAALLRRHLEADRPGHLSRTGAPEDPEPIVAAALTIQDDLVLMRKGSEGWRLAAACLCFPSTWSLAEKFGQPMATIHAAVPGFAGRMAQTIDRIFDNLQPDQIVERLNWSIYADGLLHHPESKSGPRPWNGLAGRFAEQAFIRVERQTLRRLPVSGDIVFTIKVEVDPVAALARHPDGAALARGLRGQLAGLDRDQLAYKNMLADRDVMLDALGRLAGG